MREYLTLNTLNITGGVKMGLTFKTQGIPMNDFQKILLEIPKDVEFEIGCHLQSSGKIKSLQAIVKEVKYTLRANTPYEYRNLSEAQKIAFNSAIKAAYVEKSRMAAQLIGK